jgi:hypothetical protein
MVNNKDIWFKTWDTDWPLTPWLHYAYFESFVYSFEYVLSTNPLQRRNNERSKGLKSEEGVQYMRQDADEQPKMQGRKGPSEVIYPSS